MHEAYQASQALTVVPATADDGGRRQENVTRTTRSTRSVNR
jgi:hypothetical protein